MACVLSFLLQAVPMYPHSSKSMNPFDLVNEPKLAHASTVRKFHFFNIFVITK